MIVFCTVCKKLRTAQPWRSSTYLVGLCRTHLGWKAKEERRALVCEPVKPTKVVSLFPTLKHAS